MLAVSYFAVLPNLVSASRYNAGLAEKAASFSGFPLLKRIASVSVSSEFRETSPLLALTPDSGKVFLASQPALYLVPTPLGNLSDLTVRAVGLLHAVDWIAAEDTRHSQRLLDCFGVRTRLAAVHEHNERSAAEGVVAALAYGKHVALITDAGTPAVSDPGAKVVRAVQDAGYPLIPVPGACAAVTALSASGLLDQGFQFVGFLPVKSAARREAIRSVQAYAGASVFYEAPHRIVDMLADLAAVLEPEREVVVARELTKRFEQIARMPLAEVNAWLAADSDRQRGEFVVLISGAPPREGRDAESERVLRLLLAELPLKSAAKLAAEITGQP